jgi:hypothetical protein
MKDQIQNRRIEQSWQAWKGTVLMVGLISLLMLVSGCYTVLAKSPRSSLMDRYMIEDLQALEEAERAAAEQEMYIEEEVVPDTGYQSDVGVGEYGLEEEYQGVGVKYRPYYEDDFGYVIYDEAAETVIVSYRQPWVRRLYVDYYYDWAFGWNLHPIRQGRVWNVGWSFAGFGLHFGSYYWYDPFYWDYFWCDPYWAHGYAAWSPFYSHYDTWYDPWYWDPWYWHDPWHWHHSYYAYNPGYYGGSYFYGGYRGPGVIVAKDYSRRSTDRRRGLADAREVRGVVSDRIQTSSGNDGRRSGDRTAVTAGTRATTGARTIASTERRTSRAGAGTGATGADNRNTTTRTTRTTGARTTTGTALERAKRRINEETGWVTGGTAIKPRTTTTREPTTGSGRTTTTRGIPRGTGIRIPTGSSSNQKRSTGRTAQSVGSVIGRVTGGSSSGSRTTTSRSTGPTSRTSSIGRISRGSSSRVSVPRTSTSRVSIPRSSGSSGSRVSSGGRVSRPPSRTTSRPPSRPTTKPPGSSGGSRVKTSGKGKGGKGGGPK